jgi:hypothetical protein
MAYAQADLGRLTPPPLARPSGPPSLRRPVLTMLALVLLSAAAIGIAVALSPALGVVAVAVVAAALVLAQRPELTVYLLVLVAPACAGLQRGLLVPGLRVSEAAIVGLGALVLIFAPRVRRPAWSGVEYALLAYAAFTVALGGYDLVIRHAALDFEELGTLLGPLQFVVLLRAVVVAMGREEHRVRAAQVMLGAAAVVGLVALAQAADLGPTRSVLTTLTGGSLYSKSLGLGVGRITGPFNIWHELAGFLMPSILLSLSLALGGGSKSLRVRYGLVCVVTTMALISTAAAGILIATTLGAIYIFWKRRVLHIALSLAVPVVLVAAIAFGGILGHRAEQQYVTPSATAYQIPYAPQSVSYRYSLFREQNAPALSGRWATGFGPDLPPQLSLSSFPYSETAYVSVLLRGGVVLLVLFLLMIVVVLRASRRAQREAETDLQWSVATAVWMTTIGYIFLQLIESYLLDAGPPHAFWAYVGLMLAAVGNRARTASGEPTRRY